MTFHFHRVRAILSGAGVLMLLTGVALLLPQVAKADESSALGEGADNTSLPWSTWGAGSETTPSDYPLWVSLVGAPDAWDHPGPFGGDAVVSGADGPSHPEYHSYIGTTVEGPGVLGYWLHLSPDEAGFSYHDARLTIDGDSPPLNFVFDGHSTSVFDAGGTHTLVWNHWHASGPERLVALDCVIFGRFLINGGAAYTTDPHVVIGSNFTGPVSTMSFREWDFLHTPTSWQTPLPYDPRIDYTLVWGAQDGSKTLACTIADELGGTVVWTEKVFLDTTPPTVSQLSSPTHPDEATWYAGRDPSFTWTGADPRQSGNLANCASGVAGYSYVLDQSPSTVPDARMDGANPTASFSGLADGVWYFHVRSVDKAGNLSTTSHRAVRIGASADTTPPVTTASGYDAAWHNKDVNVNLTVIDGGSGPDRFEISFDGGSWTPFDVDAYVGIIVTAKADHTNDGAHTVAYRGVDKAGNVETPKNCAVRIDTRRPTTKASSSATARRGRTVALKYRVFDTVPNGGKATVVIKVKNRAGKVVKTLKLGVRAVNTADALTAQFTVPRMWKAGTYKFFVYATDAAGNAQSKIGSNTLAVR